MYAPLKLTEKFKSGPFPRALGIARTGHMFFMPLDTFTAISGDIQRSLRGSDLVVLIFPRTRTRTRSNFGVHIPTVRLIVLSITSRGQLRLVRFLAAISMQVNIFPDYCRV